MKPYVKKNIFLLFAILSVIVLFTTGQALAWTLEADFNSGTVGERAQGTSGFTSAGSSTLFSDTMAHTGTQSASMAWPSGSSGFHQCRGTISYPSNVSNGGEIWLRGYFWFPLDWDWTCSPRVKIMRIHVKHSDGGNAGYHSILANSNGNIIRSNEIVSPGDIFSDVTFDKGQWQSIEMYVRLATAGNGPVFRIWKNGILLIEDTTAGTLEYSTDQANWTYIMSYWNGGAPKNQTQYLDNFVITTEKPAHVDIKGNPMIGPANTSPSPIASPSPSAPTGLVAAPIN